MLRLGFVGVGRWSRKLAESFRACGAEIAAYDRSSRFVHLGIESARDAGHQFGVYSPWRDQLANPYIDAIVAVAPPEVTTEVVLAAAAQGKPVMGTKPLWNHPETIRAPVWIDFWRLWTLGHRFAKEALDVDPDRPLALNLYGDGPFRDFPGSLDYGPHVMAALLDIQPGLTIKSAEKLNGGNGELFRVRFSPGDIVAHFGNAGQGRSDRRLAYGDVELAEAGDMSWGETKASAIQSMCRAFLADVTEGFGDSRTLDLSREGMRLLREIREKAK